MFPFDPMWVYIGAPTIVVSILILIKLRQERIGQRAESAFKGEEEEGERPSEEEAKENGLVKVNDTRAEPEFSGEKGSNDCSHYLGYLYMKKAPERTHIPTECYNCRKLLQCLYSPNVIEKVYGE